MKTWTRKLVCFFCVGSLLALCSPGSFADGNAINLSGRWVSLQYGSLTFKQSGSAFTAKWATVTATGSISGNTASFTFWSGSSYATSRDEDRGSGTLTLSANGNMLQGSWVNVSKKDPESGSFSAVRLSSLFGDNQANAGESDPASGEETDGIEVEPENAVTGQPGNQTQTASPQAQHSDNSGNTASTTTTAQPTNNPGTVTAFGLNVSNALTLFVDALTKPVTQDGYLTLYGVSILLSDAQRMGTEQINYGSETMKAESDLLRMMERLRDTLSDTSSQLFNGAQQMVERIHADTLDMLLEE